MHIVIMEPVLTGHHSGYLERIASAYLETGHVVTCVVLDKYCEHPVIFNLREKYSSKFVVFALKDNSFQAAWRAMLGHLHRELKIRKPFMQAYNAIQKNRSIDYVFLPYLDICLHAFGLFGSPFGASAWGGICMRPSFHYHYYGVIGPHAKTTQLKKRIFFRLLSRKNLNAIYSIDELLCEFVREQVPKLSERIKYVADPAQLCGSETYQTARRKLGVPDEAIVILIYGAIDERKGIDSLIQALSKPGIPKELRLMVVGKQSPGIKHLLCGKYASDMKKEGRFQVIDEFVSGDIEQMVFAAADMSWLGYKNHFSMSGVLVLSAISGTPVIATREGLIGWYADRYSLGPVIDTRKETEVVGALMHLYTAIKSNRNKIVNEDILGTHSWAAFSLSLTSQLELSAEP